MGIVGIPDVLWATGAGSVYDISQLFSGSLFFCFQFTNICSTDIGRGIFVAEELPEEDSKSPNGPTQTKSSDDDPQPETSNTEAGESELNSGPLGDHTGSTVGRKGSVVDHQQAMVDHRDVVQVTVKGILAEHKELCERATALIFNISMAKVNVFKLGTGIVFDSFLLPKIALLFTNVMVWLWYDIIRHSMVQYVVWYDTVQYCVVPLYDTV